MERTRLGTQCPPWLPWTPLLLPPPPPPMVCTSIITHAHSSPPNAAGPRKLTRLQQTDVPEALVERDCAQTKEACSSGPDCCSDVCVEGACVRVIGG
jgi:hypothetical protein